MSNASLASEYATDTMGLVLRLEGRHLGAQAQAVFAAAEAGQTVIHIPAMVLAETLYLSEKGRILIGLTDVFQLLKDFSNFKEFPMNCDILQSAIQITDIPELHDRLISANAKFMSVELITNDPKIDNSAFVKTIW